MAGDPPEDRIRLFPPLSIGGHQIALEIEVHGAWQDGTYVTREERTPSVALAMHMLWEIVNEHRKKQQEGKA